MGNDGTGKTSIAMALENKLVELGVSVEYCQGFTYIFLSSLTRLFSRNPSARNAEKKFSKGERNLLLNLWPFLVFFDCIVTSINLKFFKRKKVVLFDRYFYDFLIAFEHLGCSNRLIRKLFLFLPRPDIAFILDVSPHIAFERKKDTHAYNLKYYAAQRQRYLELVHKLEIRVINTEGSLKDSVNEVFNQLQPLL